jgi:peptidoglycan DL-endopeptidase CwlO
MLIIQNKHTERRCRVIKKKLLVLSTTIILGIGSQVALPTGHAEIAKLSQDQKLETSSTQDELKGIKEQLKRINKAIQDNHNIILKTEKEIEATNSDVKKLESDITTLEEKIKKRNEILKNRVITYQESGGSASYIEVLLGSTSFSNFVDRVDTVAKLVQADRDLLEQQDNDKSEQERKLASLEKKLASLEDMNTEYQGMQVQATEQQKQFKQLKENLENIEHEQEQKIENDLVENPVIEQREDSTSEIDADQEYIKTIITAGYKYIGNSVYVFGGGRSDSDIANGRFDCSGFVHWVFSQAGIDVGSTTDTLKNSGTQVPVSDLQPGDLVFFDTYKKDGHVGIYIGNGEFIGSQSSTGVAIADMSTGYWKDTFNGRVIRI